MNIWLKIRRPIGYLLMTALIWAVLFAIHAIPNIVVDALI